MSYGTRMRDATGAVTLDTSDTFARLVHVETLAHDFSGTFSVPGFDQARGAFVLTFDMFKYRTDTDAKLAIDAFWNSSDYIGGAVNPFYPPTLAWNDTTKVMTVTAGAVVTDFTPPVPYVSDVRVIFLHWA